MTERSTLNAGDTIPEDILSGGVTALHALHLDRTTYEDVERLPGEKAKAYALRKAQYRHRGATPHVTLSPVEADAASGPLLSVMPEAWATAGVVASLPVLVSDVPLSEVEAEALL